MLPWALHQTVLGVSRAWPEYTWLCAGSVGHQAHLEGFSLPQLLPDLPQCCQQRQRVMKALLPRRGCVKR